MNSLAFTLEHKPFGYRGIPDGKTMAFYRGDKILSGRKNQVDAILSRGVKNAGESAGVYIEHVKSLLESSIVPNQTELGKFQEFFSHEREKALIRWFAGKVNHKRYKTWCDLFIDFHTDKTFIDPFISISQERRLAETFAQGIGEEVIRVRFRGNRILNDRYNIGKSNGTEFFVLGAIRNDEIIH